MLAYLIRRILSTIPVMGVVAVVVFMLLHLAPGDPAAIIAGDNATADTIAQIRDRLGLNDPIVVQFWRWLMQVLRGDLGISIFSNVPVTTLILQRLEPTLSLAALTLFIAVSIALVLGVLAAWRAGGLIDRLVMGFAALGFSLPVFVVGYTLVYFLAGPDKYFPVQGYTPISEGVVGWLRNLVLPATALGLAYVALIARITRTAMLDVLAEDYIRTAKAKGVATRPMPGMLNTVSVMTTPLISNATPMPMTVTTGTAAFLSACLNSTGRVARPLALAVRI